MKTVAIMQPYLFPYLGYFQLFHAADTFVLLDNVNYIQRGWINRNRILGPQGTQSICLPVVQASQHKTIMQHDLCQPEYHRPKLLKLLQHTYSKAPYYQTVLPLITQILEHKQTNLAAFIQHSLIQICTYLELDCEFQMASECVIDSSLTGQARILALCEQQQATHYVNLPGGEALYDKRLFIENGFSCGFLRMQPVHYSQFNREFIANLSIIDVLMFNDKDSTQRLLENYDID